MGLFAVFQLCKSKTSKASQRFRIEPNSDNLIFCRFIFNEIVTHFWRNFIEFCDECMLHPVNKKLKYHDKHYVRNQDPEMI